MIISVNQKNISSKSSDEIKEYVNEVEARTVVRPCHVCETRQDIVPQMFILGDRFFFLPVCRDCLKDHLEAVKDFLREYAIVTV